MIDAYKKFWTRAFDFKGRSNRGDYWWPVLANILIIIIILIASGAAGEDDNLFSGIYVIYILCSIIPNISIIIRRLRDIGKHWGWYFIQAIPIIGSIYFIYLMSKPTKSQS